MLCFGFFQGIIHGVQFGNDMSQVRFSRIAPYQGPVSLTMPYTQPGGSIMGTGSVFSAPQAGNQDWTTFTKSVNQPESPVVDKKNDNPALSRPQKMQSAIYYALGEKYYETNHFSHAIDAFDEYLKLNPTDYRAYNKRGVAKATIKDYGGAFADYTKAISIQPGFYNAYINRGNLWVYLGDLAHKKGNHPLGDLSAKNALADFTRAIWIEPTRGVAYENRSELYSSLGMQPESVRDKGIAIQIQRLLRPHPQGLKFTPPRIALVLANDDYDGTENDLNGGPLRDAGHMAQKLRSYGFQVITGANLTGAETKMKVAEFINKLEENPNAVSLVYYSGHGGSIDGDNYLIPVDYTGVADQGFMHEAVSVDYLLKQLKATNSYFNMIFLDACRTPLPEVSAFKSGRPALKHWETEPGSPGPGLANTWIEYASRPMQPALQDNNEGLYTKYLLQYMDRPDLSLKDVSMYTSYALESDPVAINQHQHARTQTDLSQTSAIAEAFCFADQNAINQARQNGNSPTLQNIQNTLPRNPLTNSPFRISGRPKWPGSMT